MNTSFYPRLPANLHNLYLQLLSSALWMHLLPFHCRCLSCPTEPNVESIHKVRAVFQVPSGKAQALLQKFLRVGHGEGEDDVQEYVLKLLMKVLILVVPTLTFPRNNKYRQPVFDKLQTYLTRKISNIEVRTIPKPVVEEWSQSLSQTKTYRSHTRINHVVAQH